MDMITYFRFKCYDIFIFDYYFKERGFYDMNYSNTIKQIRICNNMSQKETINGQLSQSNYSKFEKGKIDISAPAFVYILNNLNVSLDELEFIHNNYSYSERKSILHDFFDISVNNKALLKDIMERCEHYLVKESDIYIEEIILICEALILLHDTYDFFAARLKVEKVWNRLSNKDQLFINDIFLINSIFFIFPIETAKETLLFVEKSIKKYKNFQNVKKLIVNIKLNMSLLYIDHALYKNALNELKEIEQLAKEYNLSIQLGLIYIRKGISLTNLNCEGQLWIDKGLSIFSALEKIDLLDEVCKELNRYIHN